MLPRILTNYIYNRKTTVKKVVIFVIILLLFTLFFSGSVFAQNKDIFGLQPVGKTIGLGGEDIRLIIARIIRALLGLLGIIALLIVIYAGYVIMTSEGNEEKVTQGKRILTNAVIGLIIILSAFSIAQFIINALSGGFGGQGEPGKERQWESFYGSGALGRVVKDHYPFRDQKGVKRNTKIVVTFAEPIDPSTIIENTNRTCWDSSFVGPTTTCKDTDGKPVTADTKLDNFANPYYGDCLMNADFDWSKSCDHLKTNAVQIHTMASSTDYVQAVAMTVYQDGDKHNAYTFVFKPIEPKYLGSETEDVWYVVRLTNNIKRKIKVNDQVVGAFDGQFAKYYEWKFQTDTNLDFDPPYVEDVYPADNEATPRNTIIQVNFSEPVDPTVTQGMSGPTSPFNHIIFSTTTITGEWKITNGYQTIEFVSNIPCGLNSCGEPMYCLPVECADPQNKDCTSNYETLIRTAEVMTSSSFESFPFTGVADMAGNALDNGPKNKPDSILANPHKPGNGNPGNSKQIGTTSNPPNEEAPDNYWWTFVVQNIIDRTSPYIQLEEPGIDQESVQGTAPLRMYFSKRMWMATLYNIYLDEFPTNFEDPGSHVKVYCKVLPPKDPPNDCLSPIWFITRTKIIDGRSVVTLGHRDFGPNKTDLYYFPIIPSTVKSLNFNCIYPGRGPVADQKNGSNQSPECIYKIDDNGNVLEDNGKCVKVDGNNAEKDTGCVQTTIIKQDGEDFRLKPDVKDCTTTMYQISTY